MKDKAEAWEEGAETAWNRSTPEINGMHYHWRHEGEPTNPYRKENEMKDQYEELTYIQKLEDENAQLRLQDETKYWRMKAAEWQKQYEELKNTFYQQWARHQKQHDARMKRLEEEYTYESAYIQKLEDENAQLRAELEKGNK